MAPRISIITINYNDMDGLHATLASIAAQTSSDYELIVVDGHSGDGSAKVIEDFNDIIDLWVSEPDKGIYDAMNKGVSLARGDYINFMNSGDNFYDREVIAKASTFIESHNPDVFYGKSFARGTRQFLPHKPELWMGMICTHQAAFCKRTLHQRFPFSNDFKISADYRFFVECETSGATLIEADIDVALVDISGLSRQQAQERHMERLRICHEFYRTPETFAYNQEFAQKHKLTLPNWAATKEGWLNETV